MLLSMLVSALAVEGHCDAPPSVVLPGDLSTVLEATVTVLQGDTTGSGVFVDRTGTVLTAAHVVVGARDVEVRWNGKRLLGTVTGIDVVTDLARVSLANTETPCLGLAPSAPAIGSPVFAVGNPGGQLDNSVSSGIVSGLRKMDGHDFVQTDAPVSPGSSGGPLLDAGGGIVGVVSRKVIGAGMEGLAFASVVGPTSIQTLTPRATSQPPSRAPVVRNAPPDATPSPPPKRCKMVETSVDTFTGAKSVKVEGPRGFRLYWSEKGGAFGLPLAFDAWIPYTGHLSAPVKPADPAFLLKLDNGTLVEGIGTIPETGLFVMETTELVSLVPMSRELLATLAVSPPQVLRWNVPGGQHDMTFTAPTKKVLAANFACFLAAIPTN